MIDGEPTEHLKRLVYDALMGGDKLDPRYFSHDEKQLFVRVDQLIISKDGMTFKAGGKALFAYNFPIFEPGAIIDVNLSPRSCIEIQVTS